MRLRRGTWQPLLPPRARMAVVMAVPVEALIRAWDYLTPVVDGDWSSPALTVVERMMPLPVWGALCAIIGITVLWGLAMRWPRTAIAGLRLGAATYALLAVGQWWAVFGNPWLDGIRGAATVTILAFAYLGMSQGYSQQIRRGR